MRIDAAELSDPRTLALLDLLARKGGEAFIVGGAVRNALMSLPVDDLDIATSLRPETVMTHSAEAGFSAHPTGIEHGTVTVVVDGLAHEVTTYRRDVETDGRRAVVAFADSLMEDAQRRDFTMNALYLDRNGTVHDPVGGLPDLHARRLRFIGDARARIREDYLRTLRFFRFSARFSRPPYDADALSACAELAEGIDSLSAERITMEMRKLLTVTNPVEAMEAMEATGILSRVVPEARLAQLSALLAAEGKREACWRRRLLLIGGSRIRLRLSNTEARYFRAAEQALARHEPTAIRAHLYGADVARDVALVEAAILQVLPPDDLEAEVARGVAATFPVEAHDLMPPLEPGPALGAELERLRELWRDSDFSLDRAALMAVAKGSTEPR